MRRDIFILPLVLVIASLSTPCWGLAEGDYEEKFDAQGKKLTIDWGLFDSIGERRRLERQLEVLWELFNKDKGEFRLIRRFQITKSTEFFSLSDEIKKDNDLLRITLSRSGDSIVSGGRILKTLRSRPFLYFTTETIKYRRRKVVRDLGRGGYYYEENGEIKYAAVDTVELLQREEEREKYVEDKERREREAIDEGF
jgi:hypothetical protein